MKRLLIITYYWPPSGGSGVQRWVKFAKYLPQEGWQPVVYTPENPELTTVDESLEAEIPPSVEVLRTPIRSIENGFGEFRHRKVEEMVKFFATGGTGVTKLNKKMFYADFLHFKRHGISISGLRYQAIHYGPVPVHYATVYDNIPGLDKSIQLVGDSERISYYCTSEADVSVFSEKELESLNTVERLLGALSTSEVVALSHRENAWEEHYGQKEIIPYSDAYRLKI